MVISYNHTPYRTKFGSFKDGLNFFCFKDSSAKNDYSKAEIISIIHGKEPFFHCVPCPL